MSAALEINKKHVIETCQDVLPVNKDGIPAILKTVPRWILWKKGNQTSESKYQKLPSNKYGYTSSALDEKNWLAFPDVIEGYEGGGFSGIGFVLIGEKAPYDDTEEDLYLVGIDIDGCVDNEEIINDDVKKIINDFPIYWEFSPSGLGVRGFFLSDTEIKNKNKNGSEIYISKRFLTITGHGQGELKKLNKSEINNLISALFPGNPDETNYPPSNVVEFTDISKLKKALNKINADCSYEDWFHVLCAISSSGCEGARSLAMEWSQSAPHRYNEDVFNATWDSIEPNGGITVGTLFHMAKPNKSVKKGSILIEDEENENLLHSDLYNAKYFAKKFRGSIKFVFSSKTWLLWNGKVWKKCNGEEIAAAKETVIEITEEFYNDYKDSPSDRNKYNKFNQSLRNHTKNKIESMLYCAASEQEIAIKSDAQLDSNPWLISCKNGTVDLKNEKLLSHQPDDLITRMIDAEYIEDFNCDKWLRFLKESLGDDDTVRYIQKALGYSLTGIVSEEILHFCYGIGRNGKSVFANIIGRIFNDYCVTAQTQMLMQRDSSQPSNDFARLAGARLVLANETRGDQKIDDMVLKNLVSTEKMSARFLYGEYFEFQPQFKLWVRGNHKPIIMDNGLGLWRRIRLVPFDNQVDEDKVDYNLEEALWSERNGIFSWMVEGCKLWQNEGLKASDKISRAGAEYKKESDIFGEFIDEEYTLNPTGKIPQKVFYESYVSWCARNGHRNVSKTMLNRKLEEKGISKDAYIGKERAYQGIMMKGIKNPGSITF